jgi:two-component system OmpR family response regulator
LGTRVVAVPTVLVVDDDPVTARVFARVLEEHGYHALTAADGTEIWPLLEQVTIALVVVELQMPGMNGWEVIRRLRPRFRFELPPGSASCKIVVASARADEETVAFVRHLGADVFLRKPVTPIALIRTVDSLLVPFGCAAVAAGPGVVV